MNIALVVLLGPDPSEIDDLIDLFDSVSAYATPSTEKVDVYIVNDGNDHADLGKLGAGIFRRTKVLKNPLTGLSGSAYDRMAAGMLSALRLVAQSCRYEFVLKADTDALVIGEFANRVLEFFATTPKSGMIDSYMRFPDNKKRPGNAQWSKEVRGTYYMLNSMRCVMRNRHLSPVKSIGLALRRRSLIGQARRGGYEFGHHVLGGSYAISGVTLSCLMEKGFLDESAVFSGTGLPEDVAVSILIMAAGFSLEDFNGKDDVFGIWHRSLGFSLPELLDKGYAVIHSTKSQEGQDERTLRARLKERRSSGDSSENCSDAESHDSGAGVVG